MITPSFGLTATERVLPKLALDFTTASLDSRITFTRTTGASNPATYVNSSGYITAATNNQPRFDYDLVTLACKGLLIEEARTNLSLQSQTFSVSPWVRTNCTCNIDASIGNSPEGTANASKLVVNNGIGRSGVGVYQILSKAASSTTYTASVYVKAGEVSRVKISARDSASSANYAEYMFNASTGATISAAAAGGTFTNASSTITAVGNSWFKVTLTYTTGTETSIWSIAVVNGTSTGTGDGSGGFYIWGAQLEAGAFATSYIPTTSAALTRNADVATMTGTNFSDWFNASEGAVEMQALVRDLGTSIYPGWFAIDDTTLNNEALIMFSYTSGLTTLVRHSSATVFSVNRNGTLSSTPSVVKALLSYANANFKVTYQGATPTTQASGALPSGLVQMRLGVYNSKQLNGHIQKINYWPQSLQTAEVQAFSK